MRELCLSLAEKADELEAGALRDVASNYKTSDEPEREFGLGRVLVIAAIVYAICLPIFWYAGGSFELAPVPTGKMVEQLKGLKPMPDGWFKTRTYRFVRLQQIAGPNSEVTFKDAEPMALVVYEDTKQLPASNYRIQQLTPKDTWRFVTLRSSDGTSPRENGRRYYLVQP